MTINKQHIHNTLLLWKFANEEIEGMSKFLALETINDQFYRRLLIRNIFSVIETYLNITKEIILTKIVTENSNLLGWKEIAILNEKTAKLDAKGNAHAVENFQYFEPSFRFTMSTFAKVFNAEPLDPGNANFERLKRLSKLRNSITHPKISSVLLVSNDDIKDVVTMFGWFVKSHSQMNAKFIEWIKKITDNG